MPAIRHIKYMYQTRLTCQKIMDMQSSFISIIKIAALKSDCKASIITAAISE